jgi:cytochrome c-type biogenesis protein CcmF
MENIGALAILLAFCLTIFSIAASLVGAWKKKPFLIVSAERAVICVWGLVTVASGLLIYALMTGDYRLAYVAAHSNKAMPMIYKFSAWWGGQEGSLLMWNFILATYALVVVLQNRRKHRALMPYVTTTMMVTQGFFLMLIAFLVPPFQVLSTGGKSIVDVGDGQGLNPLLQYWTMVIHPPILYLGYVGYIVPFAFALGSLITKQKGDEWIFTTRRWAIVTWLFQGTGILLGAGWAYSVLGWGGYWGWDPVENASFLPWLTSTAFLHSVTMQEKKGMMKVWNLVLVASTFFLCIFGTFLTRSGIVSSVHAFAQSPIGPYFVAFLAVTIAITILLILSRLDYLKSEAPLESVVSRESSFLFNNLILLASCFAILWGTLFPVISEAIAGEKISVDAPWFNRVNVPIGLALLFLTGVGPLLAWRRSTPDNLKRNFLWPTVGMVATIGILVAMGIYFAVSPKLSDKDARARISPLSLAVTIGAGVGFYDGVFGPGTGSFFMLGFVLLLGYGVVRATAHTKLLNFTSNLASLLIFAFSGKVVWIIGLAMGLGQFVGAQLGSRLAMRHGARLVRPLLVLVCIAMAIRLLMDPGNPFHAYVTGGGP